MTSRPHPRPVVAHVNYMFFASTQSFIHFYLSRFEATHPLCLTRTPESADIRNGVPPRMAGDFYVYGKRKAEDAALPPLRRAGLALRRFLSRCPPRLSVPLLNAMNRTAVPLFRRDDDPDAYVDWVASVLERRDAKLLHAHFGPLAWRMLEVKRRLGLPIVASFLGDDAAPALDPWWWWLVRRRDEDVDWAARMQELFAEADLILVEGPYLRRQLIERGCPTDKIAIQRIALPLDEMPALRTIARKPRARRVILFAARLCEQKGALYAMDAIRRLRAARRDFEFRVIGSDTLTDGAYAARVNAAARSKPLRNCVRMLGFLNREEYLRELADADVFLHPSVTDSSGRGEGGAPTSILEAQALGIPVVATRHCDIPNVTIDGETAILVPERDADSLAAALDRLLDDDELRRTMGTAGRRFIEKNHDVSKEVAILEERYRTLLESR